jgi:hypothetical protein
MFSISSDLILVNKIGISLPIEGKGDHPSSSSASMIIDILPLPHNMHFK